MVALGALQISAQGLSNEECFRIRKDEQMKTILQWMESNRAKMGRKDSFYSKNRGEFGQKSTKSKSLHCFYSTHVSIAVSITTKAFSGALTNYRFLTSEVFLFLSDVRKPLMQLAAL